MHVVCYVAEGKSLDWEDVRKSLGRKEFLTQVLEFDTANLKNHTRIKCMELISKDEWDVDRIAHAYKAAGSMALWCESQLKYADLLERVEPLTSKIKELKDEAQINIDELEKLELEIATLTKNIEQYKKDYAELIGRVEQIKKEMEKVESKTTRSERLLLNLSSEKGRWETQSENFQGQLTTMTGDTLLAASFLAYVGFFDQYYRNMLINHFKAYLNEQGLLFKQDMSLVEFLSIPSERMIWQGHKLPDDDLCNQNAIILARYNRYPLVIDPSGQAMEF